MSANPHPEAVSMILEKINSYNLFDRFKINWCMLGCNDNPEIVSLLIEKMAPSYKKAILLSLWEKLIDEITIGSIQLRILSNLCTNTNPNVLTILKKYPYAINGVSLSSSWSCSDAIALLRENPDKIDWFYLSNNAHPDAITLLKENPDKLVWYSLSNNAHPYAIALLRETPDKIDWYMLSSNPSSDAIILLKENPDKINWDSLSSNVHPDAIVLLRENPDKIDWDLLSSNPSSDAITLLKENPAKINWHMLSANSSSDAITLLKENSDKITWHILWTNRNPEISILLNKHLDQFHLTALKPVQSNPLYFQPDLNFNKSLVRILTKNEYVVKPASNYDNLFKITLAMIGICFCIKMSF
jgi:hypothetical protein